MRQIEDAEGVTGYLINHIGVSAVETGSGNRRDRCISRRGEVLAFIVAVERKEFVLLPREVQTDIDIPIFRFDRRYTNTDFHTLVLHLTQVSQHRVIDKRRHGHRIAIKHIIDMRKVIIRSEDESVMPETPLHPGIDGLGLFPGQVGVSVSAETEDHIGQTVRLGDSCRHEQLQGLVCCNAAQVTGQTPACAQFESREPIGLLQPFLFLYIPN